MGNLYPTKDWALEVILAKRGYHKNSEVTIAKETIKRKGSELKQVGKHNAVSPIIADVYKHPAVDERMVEFYISELFNVPVRINNRIIYAHGFSPTIYKIGPYEINHEV